MTKFKHYSYFSKEKSLQKFRHPVVCFSCRKSFKYPAHAPERICPQCKAPMIMLCRKFAVPKSSDRAQWEKVKFLAEHGFLFYSVAAPSENGGLKRVRYQRTLQEEKEFVRSYLP